MKAAFAGLAGCAIGAIAAIWVCARAPDWVHGIEKAQVLTSDIDLSYARSEGMSSCPGKPQGGLFAGTPVFVRKHGSISWISLTIQVFDKDLPVRDLAADEADMNKPVLECATVRTTSHGG